jgi:hypothetical protein
LIIGRWLFFGGESAPQTILGHDPRHKEILEIFEAAGLGATPGHLESAEGLTLYNRAGDGPVNVEIATDQFFPGTLDIDGASRVATPGKSEFAIVGEFEGFVEVPGAGYGEDRAEDFFTEERVLRRHI